MQRIALKISTTLYALGIVGALTSAPVKPSADRSNSPASTTAARTSARALRPHRTPWENARPGA